MEWVPLRNLRASWGGLGSEPFSIGKVLVGFRVQGLHQKQDEVTSHSILFIFLRRQLPKAVWKNANQWRPETDLGRTRICWLPLTWSLSQVESSQQICCLMFEAMLTAVGPSLRIVHSEHLNKIRSVQAFNLLRLPHASSTWGKRSHLRAVCISESSLWAKAMPFSEIVYWPLVMLKSDSYASSKDC